MRDEADVTERPLAEAEGPLGEAVRAYRDGAREAAPEAEAWLRLEAKLAEPASMARSVTRFSLAIAVSAVAVAALVAPEWFLPRAPAPIASSAPVETAAPPPPAPLPEAPATLRAGLTHLSASVDLVADEGATGTVTTDARPAVRLARGRVEVRSREADPSRRVRVVAEPYTFDDVGTEFAVARDAAFVELTVREGRVLVAQDGATVATLGAGSTWRGRIGDAPAAPTMREAVATSDAGAPSAASCRAFAAAEPDRAIACYGALARGTDLTAQTALYELANLQRDRGDAEGALDGYRAYETRFAGGPLGTEVKLSEIELLASTGRAQAALDRSAALLAEQPRLERASEIRLLRGNLYREALKDLPKAAAEYDRAAHDATPSGSEALFLRGACAEGLGDADAARAAYETYLARGHLPREADAKKRLEELARLKK